MSPIDLRARDDNLLCTKSTRWEVVNGLTRLAEKSLPVEDARGVIRFTVSNKSIYIPCIFSLKGLLCNVADCISKASACAASIFVQYLFFSFFFCLRVY